MKRWEFVESATSSSRTRDSEGRAAKKKLSCLPLFDGTPAAFVLGIDLLTRAAVHQWRGVVRFALELLFISLFLGDLEEFWFHFLLIGLFL